MTSKKKSTKRTEATAEKKSYTITLPVVGSIKVFVQAASEEQAIELAFEQQDWRVVGGPNTEPGEAWEAMRSISTGNVMWAPINYMIVECAD